MSKTRTQTMSVYSIGFQSSLLKMQAPKPAADAFARSRTGPDTNQTNNIFSRKILLVWFVHVIYITHTARGWF